MVVVRALLRTSEPSRSVRLLRTTEKVSCPCPLPFFRCVGSHSLLVAAGTNKGHAPVDHQRIAKLDRENEVAPPPKVAPSVGKAIGQARQAKGLTQKDLGTKIMEKPQVIAEYESGKAIPNPQILAKMERALGVKLRGTYRHTASLLTSYG